MSTWGFMLLFLLPAGTQCHRAASWEMIAHGNFWQDQRMRKWLRVELREVGRKEKEKPHKV